MCLTNFRGRRGATSQKRAITIYGKKRRKLFGKESLSQVLKEVGGTIQIVVAVKRNPKREGQKTTFSSLSTRIRMSSTTAKSLQIEGGQHEGSSTAPPGKIWGRE